MDMPAGDVSSAVTADVSSSAAAAAADVLS